MTRPALALLFASAFALGCPEYTVVDKDDGIDDLDDDLVPDIQVTPSEVNFGAVDVNDGLEHVQVVEVSNVGDATLTILGLEIDDPYAPFDFTTLSTLLLAPGATGQFEVTYEPGTSADDEANIVIESNDPDEPTTLVHLLGEALAPIIEVTPTSYDFGDLWVGCEAELPVTVANIGTAALVVYGFDFSTDFYGDMTFGTVADANGADDGLVTLLPSESTDVYVYYAPMDANADVAYLSVESNDPATPLVQVTQEGNGDFYGRNLDMFEQPIGGSTDIIFAVDKSGSMDDNIAAVRSNFGVFVTTLASLASDYQVAAIVQNDGCVYGGTPWIDNTHSPSDAETIVGTMLNGSAGGDTERAFTILGRALSGTSRGGCNEGLVRERSTLNLVGISDEREQSSGSWSDWVLTFQGYKTDPSDVVIHAIGGDYPSGCGGTADPYTGMYEAVTATGGIFLSICASDWASHLEVLAESSAVSMVEFELTQRPVPTTIEVRVDGSDTTVGWTYDASTNSVTFEPDHVPDEGATIEIEYALYGDCEA